MDIDFRNKFVLITAGPTWVRLDSVRVISNTATGKTGFLLAEELSRLGAKVTLVLGPVSSCCLNADIRILRFNFFEELAALLNRELKRKHYDIVIHSAAVADYRPRKSFSKKIKSGLKKLHIDLAPLPKIIDSIKGIDPGICLVGFKFEHGLNKDALIKSAKVLLNRSSSDLVVANTVLGNKYKAFIVSKERIYGPISDKKSMVSKLLNLL